MQCRVVRSNDGMAGEAMETLWHLCVLWVPTGSGVAGQGHRGGRGTASLCLG